MGLDKTYQAWLNSKLEVKDNELIFNEKLPHLPSSFQFEQTHFDQFKTEVRVFIFLQINNIRFPKQNFWYPWSITQHKPGK